MTKLRVLDLFSGGGGSSYGARLADCEIVAGIDAWDVAAQTYSANFGARKGLNFRLEGTQIRDEVLAIGRIDIMLASPECTNHTCARGARPRCEDSRMTAWQVLHHAKALRPSAIVVENVVQMRSWDRYDEFLDELFQLGYHVKPVVLDAADFGVPQTRRRLFLICTTTSTDIEVTPHAGKRVSADRILDPPGTWRRSPLFCERRAQATIARAERAIEAVGPSERFLLVYYGSDYAGGWQTLERPLRTMTTLDRFALVEPATGGHTMRMLQVPELRRAMGFGEDFKLENSRRRDNVKLLGNGVCPPVMEAIVRSLTREMTRSMRRSHGHIRNVPVAANVVGA
jgi:DNA (cytosine-5)-methyltransferase 1